MNDVPIIVNGDLNMGKEPKKKEPEKLPQKRFGFMDLFLTLIGLVLIIYGITSLTAKKEKEEPDNDMYKKQVNINTVTNYVILPLEEFNNLYTSDDIKAMKDGLLVNNLSNNAKLALANRITVQHNINNEVYVEEKDLDASMKKIFGSNIDYIKQAFSYGNRVYTYNQATKRYYLLDDSQKVNFDYRKFSYTKDDLKDDNLLIKEYIAYTDKNGSWTLDDTKLDLIIDDDNIEQNYQLLHYFEYTFKENKTGYELIKITIK